jgi:serine/threonine protein kinase
MTKAGSSSNNDFFIPPDRRQPTDEYTSIIEDLLPLRWRIYRSHFWTQALSPSPLDKIQGWKIHISSRLSSAKEILAKVASICWDANTEFKFASDSYIHNLLLSKNVRRQSGGKFMTIYPRSDPEFDNLLERLYVNLKEHEGPYILSDRQYKDSKVVFYRYGGFHSLEKVNATGVSKHCILNEKFEYVEDQRLARFYLPAFIEDRHATPKIAAAGVTTIQSNGKPPARLFGEFFEIQGVIKYSNTGGVYLGRDIRDDSVVIVKEARPGIDYGTEESDATQQLRTEFEVMQRIAHLGMTPRPLALFQVWEHLFLAQEMITGDNLQSFIASQSKIIAPQSNSDQMRDWFEKTNRIAVDLLKLIHLLHKNNVVHGDLSPSNVMISGANLEIRLIDFESAFIEGISQAPNIFTEGYGRPDRHQRAKAEQLDDQYALGCILLYLHAPSHINMSLMNDYAELALDMLNNDYNLPSEYGQCVRQLLAPESVNLDAMANRLAKVSYEQVTALADSAPPDFDKCLPRLYNRIIEYIENKTNLDGDWQLFPVDTEQVIQLSFDHGVLGTIYALHRIRGNIHGDLKEWLLRACQQATPLPGLLNGAAGAAWLLQEMACPEEALQLLSKAWFHEILFTNASLGFGYAGVGMALLQGWLHTGAENLLAKALRLADSLCVSAVRSEAGWYWDSNEAGVIPLGLHNGASGVALFLLHAYAAAGNSSYLEAAKAAIGFDMSHAQPSGMPSAFHPNQRAEVVSSYLRDGTAGVAMVALRLHALTQDPSYLPFLAQAKTQAAQKYTVCGGLGRGLAGLGLYLLDRKEWLGDAEAHQQALRLAHGLTLCLVQRPEGITAPAHLESTVSVSYLSGSAGMALFLHRLAHGGASFHFCLDDLLRRKLSNEYPHVPKQKFHSSD